MKISILGTGNSGLTMAAHLSLAGHNVSLWGRSSERIQQLNEKSNQINISGVLNGIAIPTMITTNLAESIHGSELILVTTPASAHSAIATALAPNLVEDQTIILNPGRTGGVLDFVKSLKTNLRLVVGEAQTIVYTCRQLNSNSVEVFSFKNGVLLACYNTTSQVLSRCSPVLPPELSSLFLTAENMITTSLGNVGMILHCAPTILNTGWIESRTTRFLHYYEGISPSIANLLECLDQERLMIAAALGTEIESTMSWLKRSYGVGGKNLYECILDNKAYSTIDAPTTLQHRYLTEDVPFGLVPLEALGKSLNIPTPLTSLVIDLTNKLLNVDFRLTGRTFETLGLNKKTIDEIKLVFRL